MVMNSSPFAERSPGFLQAVASENLGKKAQVNRLLFQELYDPQKVLWPANS